MCDIKDEINGSTGVKAIPVAEAVGMVLAHDITEIRQNEFKGRAFKKGHIVRQEDICHFERLGKEHLFVLHIGDDEMHEDEAAYALASALMGEGVRMEGEPKEGKINILADRDGLLKVNKDALLEFNMLGDVMCATLHDNTVVKENQVVGGTRAIPLVVKKTMVEEAITIARGRKGAKGKGGGVIAVKGMRRPKTGIVITGNEIYYGKIKDAFAPVMREKIEAVNGDIVGIYYAPDDGKYIELRLRELIESGADLLIVTGGMSVDPDDITRFAIRSIGATDYTYGSAVLPGSMFLVAYVEHGPGGQGVKGLGGNNNYSLEPSNLETLESSHASKRIPILGIPACGIYHKTTILDLILPRLLAGEIIGRKELAEMGHGGLCLNCKECRYPVCPFGK